ncbi:MAG: hypothetical protein U9R60_00055, partial [Bacteroidota bacterium]|nr:hypothetical protein [Bacteroidota bacterium]
MGKALRFAVLFYILSFAPLLVVADSVKISGKAESGAGKLVRVIKLSDQISKLEEVISTGTVNADGTFAFSVDITETQSTVLEIGLQRGEIYLQAGHQYKVNAKYIKEDYHVTLTYQENLELEIQDSREPGLNTLIQDFNNMYNQFMLDNFSTAYGMLNKARVTELIDTVNEHYKDIYQPYFRAYIKYRIALLELSGRVKSKEMLANQYFIGQPILYNNIEYMEFFNQYFSQLLITSSQTISNQELLSLINEELDYHGLEEKLKLFPFLADKQFRELALLKSLKDLFYTTGFDRKNILKYLSQLARESNYPQNRAIALALTVSLTRFARGTKAPDIMMEDPVHKQITLDDLPEKPTYLIFYTSKNLSCIAEMDLLKDISKEFAGKMDIEVKALAVRP